MKALLDAVPHGSRDIVFLSGSRAEEFSNERSDYDVYVLTDSASEIEAMAGFTVPSGERVRVQYGRVGDARVEVQYWPLAYVADAVSMLREAEVRPLLEIWPRQLELLHRLRIGVPLANKRAFRELKASIDFALLERYLIRFHDRVFESYLEDAAGALEAGRPADGVFAAQLALDHIVDAYLSARHDTNQQAKWRHRRILRAANGSGDLAGRYLASAVDSRSAGGLAGLEAAIYERLNLAESVNCCVQLGLDFDQLEPSAPTDSYSPGLIRSPGVRLKRFSDSVIRLVQSKGTNFLVNETSGVIWALVDGTSGDDVVKRAAKFFRVSQSSEPSIAEALKGFVEEGIVQARPCAA